MDLDGMRDSRHYLPMTDEQSKPFYLSKPAPQSRTRASSYARANPWIRNLAIAGYCFLALGVVVLLIPPHSSDTDLGSIVNFPAMFAQYATALVAALVGVGFLIAWGVAGAAEWRAEHPYQVR